jgi:hypothetical protein
LSDRSSLGFYPLVDHCSLDLLRLVFLRAPISEFIPFAPLVPLMPGASFGDPLLLLFDGFAQSFSLAYPTRFLFLPLFCLR